MDVSHGLRGNVVILMEVAALSIPPSVKVLAARKPSVMLRDSVQRLIAGLLQLEFLKRRRLMRLEWDIPRMRIVSIRGIRVLPALL